ncbi:MAG: hypothetical protein A3G34_07730 [Candidatus Lindowbacteria bacterium RIFCSPLOWO2_12_FULL_62_27]|nr:MAG: hypothetical protein A3G34_07730 [Candidatus Lindowbacteria bacterium RIFCSPLOWO2_12_FULL_62_27]OGH63822.1 MAG: hypothetical protein A3I06_04855 [Candidatus Lindowbacteria bacterium RIFCSPLOWO2_02_FULL_62_12]
MRIIPLLFIAAALAGPVAAEDTPASPLVTFDSFGLPSYLTILEGEKRQEDLEVKQTVRTWMIMASRMYYDGQYPQARQKLDEGILRGYFVLHQKRIHSRVDFMTGRLDSSIMTAAEIASDTDAVVDDQDRLDFLKSVRRYLDASLETQGMAYKPAAVVKGDEKDRQRFITPVGVEVDRLGRILLASFGTDEVVVFTKGLEFLMKLSDIPSPFDVAVDEDGNIYVSSFSSDRIFRYKRDGTFLGAFGQKGRGPGEFFGPEGLAISPDRYLYVVDGGNHRIQKFTLDGRHLMSFGSRGGRPGEFQSPRSVLVRTTPRTDTYVLLVMSQEGNLVQRFDRYGNFLGVVPTADLAEPRDFDWTSDRGLLFSTAHGDLAVLDEKSDTLILLQDEFGKTYSFPGMSGVAIDGEAGLVYVADQITHELRVLRPGTMAERTLLNVSDIDFEHYPFVGVTFQVTNGSGDPITGLSRRNFVVQEDNNRVAKWSVRPLSQTGPLNLIVHLDPSSAMDRRAVLVRTFLDNLSRALPTDFYLSIRKGRRTLLTPTDNPYLIRKSLDLIDEMATSTFPGDLYETLSAFKDLRGRRNILLVTTREEDITPADFSSLFLDFLNEGVSLFILHLTDRQLPVLKTLCRRSGGSYRQLQQTSISDIAFELASSKTASYFLVYASPYGTLQQNTPVDVTLRLYYLTDVVSDRLRYFAPQLGRQAVGEHAK